MVWDQCQDIGRQTILYALIAYKIVRLMFCKIFIPKDILRMSFGINQKLLSTSF